MTLATRLTPIRPLRLTLGVIALTTLAGCSAGSSSPPNSAHPTASRAAVASGPPGGQLSRSGEAATLQQAYVDVVKKVGPSVVQIETTQGLGSGIIFDTKGDIVTNAHVVEGSSTFQLTLSDGKRRSGTLVGAFPNDDLAVVKASQTDSMQPATFADSSKLQVGDICMAIGNPLGLRSSVTNGIVSAVGRTVSEGNGYTLPDTIQTSAAINPGNSGGALVDLNADVIGIPTLAATEPSQQLGGGAAPGIGFAIPSNTVKDIAGQLISNGKVTSSHRAYLGIRAATASDGSGVIVSSVQSGSPAAQAGLQQDDLITAINGTSTPDTNTLNQVLAELKPGDQAKVSVVRGSDGSKTTVTVTVGELPGG